MDLLEAIETRRSIRSFTERPIEGETLAKLHELVRACNEESGLHIQLCLDNPEAFDSRMASYGDFRNVRNHLALVGPAGPHLDERCGYYGERIVLEAQRLGLNTCWVALTYKKRASAAQIGAGEKMPVVIAIGYGANHGHDHKVKPIEKLCREDGPAPDWFAAGMHAAQLAPTAMNQQQFVIERTGNIVNARALFGPYAHMDLGIVAYHFELGANAVSTDWRWDEEFERTVKG